MSTTTAPQDALMAIIIPIAAVAIIVALLTTLIVYFICRCKAKLGGGYSKVRHNLEDEEREFQRKLEESIPTYDELFKFEDDDDVELDEKELERLTVLEGFANSLLEKNADMLTKAEDEDASPSTPETGASPAPKGSPTTASPPRTARDEGSKAAASPKPDAHPVQDSDSSSSDSSEKQSSSDTDNSDSSAGDAAHPTEADNDAAAQPDATESSETEQY